MTRITIIGGGLGGLISAILLARNGLPVTLIERKKFPFHRVCGEYISREVIPFLRRNDLYPSEFEPPQLLRFQLSSIEGKTAFQNLDLGGFGISRFVFDQWLCKKAIEEGVDVQEGVEVTDVSFADNKFQIETNLGSHQSDVVIAAYGKRSKLDINLARPFIQKRSPYVGVKYHLKTDHPADLIALHNFEGGYCGVSNVESGKTNLCYLVHREQLRKYGDVESLEREVLFRNPWLKSIISNSQSLFEKPEVINEISFATKAPVENHMLMVGDAAGMITPLCGNGMAIAIHSAQLAVNSILDYHNGKLTREGMEKMYHSLWTERFRFRLWFGRQVQNLFGNKTASSLALQIALRIKPVANAIIKNTHGKPF